MNETVSKLLVWFRGEFILLKRSVSALLSPISKILTEMEGLRADLKAQKPPVVNVEPPKVEVNVPEIKVPEAKVTVTMPEMPEIKIPEIKVPKPLVTVHVAAPKIPAIKVPKPEVTVNVHEREIDFPESVKIEEVPELLRSLIENVQSIPGFNLWDYVRREDPVPVILVDEKKNYYKAMGGGGLAVTGGGPDLNSAREITLQKVATEETLAELTSRLGQLLAKIPHLNVNGVNQLRVATDTSSSVNHYGYVSVSANSEDLNVFSPNMSSQRWIGQRSLITFT